MMSDFFESFLNPHHLCTLPNLLNYLAHKNPALGLDFWNLCQTKKFVFILDFRNGPFDDFRHVWIKSQNFKSWENLK